MRRRFANLMAPCNRGVYEAVADACDADLVEVVDWRRLGTGEFDGGFVCSPPVAWLAGAVVPVAAPVLDDPRFGGQPLHASEVMVAAGSPFLAFDDLRGRRWAVNEPASWSGYWLGLRRAGDWSFFGRVVHAGSHERAMRLIAGGTVDAAAIDCHVLARLAITDPALVAGLRSLESLGPSPTQPFVLRADTPARTRAALRDATLALPPQPEYLLAGWSEPPDYEVVDRCVSPQIMG